MAGLLATAEFDTERMRAAADAAASAATDLAEQLVRAGHAVPRGARRRRARSCAQAVERGVPLEELVMTEPHLGPEALALLEPGRGRPPPDDARAAPAPARSPRSSTRPGPASRPGAVARREPQVLPRVLPRVTPASSRPRC